MKKKEARREVGLGAVAIPKAPISIINARRGIHGQRTRVFHGASRLAQTYSDTDLTPLEQFPLNLYLTPDPGVDLASLETECNRRGGSARRIYSFANSVVKEDSSEYETRLH